MMDQEQFMKELTAIYEPNKEVLDEAFDRAYALGSVGGIKFAAKVSAIGAVATAGGMAIYKIYKLVKKHKQKKTQKEKEK